MTGTIVLYDEVDMELTTRWLDGMMFESDLDGHKLLMDAGSEVGGRDRGPTPKPLLMVALAGCTGMDVVSILKKMRQDLESFEVRTRGVLADEHPKKYTSIEVIYDLSGPDLCRDKVVKAVTLSEDRYCGIVATLRPAVEITRRIILNGEEVS